MNDSKIYLFLLISMFACEKPFKAGSVSIIDDFVVSYYGDKANQALFDRSQLNPFPDSAVIKEYVFEVGNNSNFIIAKQHPTSVNQEGNEVDKTITNYFIIVLNDSSRNEVIGPLSENEFSETSKKLDIEGIEFFDPFPKEE